MKEIDVKKTLLIIAYQLIAAPRRDLSADALTLGTRRVRRLVLERTLRATPSPE